MTDYSTKRRKNVFAHEPDPNQRASEFNRFFARFDEHDFSKRVTDTENELRALEDSPVSKSVKLKS